MCVGDKTREPNYRRKAKLKEKNKTGGSAGNIAGAEGGDWNLSRRPGFLKEIGTSGFVYPWWGLSKVTKVLTRG